VIEAATGADKRDSPNRDAGSDASTRQDIGQGNLLGGEAPHDTRRLQILTDIVKLQLPRAILV
jgi:hypothetical protein